MIVTILATTMPTIVIALVGGYLMNRTINNHFGGLHLFMDDTTAALREILAELKRLNDK